MPGENLLLGEPENVNHMMESPSQSSSNVEQSTQIEIGINTMVPRQSIRSQPSIFSEDEFQVQRGEIFIKNADSEPDYNVQNYCPNRIDDPFQNHQSLDQVLVISDNISVGEENFPHEEYNFSNEPNQNSIIVLNDPEEHQDDDSHQNNTPRPQVNQNQRKRLNGANHAHKKMITALNKQLSPSKQKQFQRLIKQEEQKRKQKLNYVLASRYGFIQYLILIKYFFGNQFVQSMKVKFREHMQKMMKKMQKQQNSQAKKYFLSLPDYYFKAFEEFTSGSVKSATETIYQMDNFKQRAYMRNGVKKVMTLQQNLQKLQK